jgi:hypothetical protein
VIEIDEGAIQEPKLLDCEIVKAVHVPRNCIDILLRGDLTVAVHVFILPERLRSFVGHGSLALYPLLDLRFCRAFASTFSSVERQFVGENFRCSSSQFSSMNLTPPPIPKFQLPDGGGSSRSRYIA